MNCQVPYVDISVKNITSEERRTYRSRGLSDFVTITRFLLHTFREIPINQNPLFFDDQNVPNTDVAMQNSSFVECIVVG
jgi:hypothetical protein